jgi:hypothetical protein
MQYLWAGQQVGNNIMVREIFYKGAIVDMFSRILIALLTG